MILSSFPIGVSLTPIERQHGIVFALTCVCHRKPVMLFAPINALVRRPRIGAPRVFVPDLRGEKFEVAIPMQRKSLMFRLFGRRAVA